MYVPCGNKRMIMWSIIISAIQQYPVVTTSTVR